MEMEAMTSRNPLLNSVKMNQDEIIDERHKVRLSKNGTKLEKIKAYRVESRVSLNDLIRVNFLIPEIACSISKGACRQETAAGD
jgi:hypothetical protein